MLGGRRGNGGADHGHSRKGLGIRLHNAGPSKRSHGAVGKHPCGSVEDCSKFHWWLGLPENVTGSMLHRSHVLLAWAHRV